MILGSISLASPAFFSTFPPVLVRIGLDVVFSLDHGRRIPQDSVSRGTGIPLGARDFIYEAFTLYGVSFQILYYPKTIH